MKLKTLDIKLLVVFDAIMREQSLTKAGRYVGMSQPTVSSALKKLRYLLKDELFVRVPGGIKPTPRSLELAQPVRTALEQLQSAFDPVEFVPETAKETIHIASSALCAAVVLPELHERLRARAPGIHVRVRPKRDPSFVSWMDSGEVHCALGAMRSPPARVEHVPLFQDQNVCVMRPSHPLAGRAMTMGDYVAADHLVLTNFGEMAHPIDNFLAKQGLERNITITINQPHLAPLFLKSSDVVLTTYAGLASRISAYDGLHVVPLPFDLGPVESHLAWPATLTNHPTHAWVRKQIRDICSKLA